MPAPTELASIAAGGFVEIDLAAESAAHPSWNVPIRTHFKRTADGWKLVGLERMADRPAANVPAGTGQRP
jgi:hypothetical protein